MLSPCQDDLTNMNPLLVAAVICLVLQAASHLFYSQVHSFYHVVCTHNSLCVTGRFDRIVYVPLPSLEERRLHWVMFTVLCI